MRIPDNSEKSILKFKEQNPECNIADLNYIANHSLEYLQENNLDFLVFHKI